ncbi:threonine--tRNA ligase, partial [bacterium]|nr:threonine--tRNA ligase [bacterium]
ELGRVLGFSLEMLRAFGFDKFHIYLSTRPKGKCVGEPERWEAAQAALRAVVTRENLAFDVDEGGGAFYGPKIDIKIKDALEREWQCSTIQFDFNLPERFDMVYVAEDGKHHRPYMIHRALLGSLERFFAVLLENCGGEYPVWLAPVQVKVVPIKDVHLSYARQRAAELQERLLRVEVDETNRPMGAKVREAKLAKIPYTIVVGDKEVEANTVSLRLRDGRQAHAVPFDEFQARICRERDTRALSSAFSDLAK